MYHIINLCINAYQSYQYIHFVYGGRFQKLYENLMTF
jgi:hypothetical protein